MSNQQVQKVKVRRLAHVGLWTPDAIAQARFYYHMLGFDILGTVASDPDNDEDENMNAFMSLGTDYHCVAFFADTRPAPTGRRTVSRTPLHHLAFEVDTDAELAALAARLQMSGVELVLGPRDGNADLGDTLWFADPDGNRLEISVTPDDLQSVPSGHGSRLCPDSLQQIALYTPHLEAMVDFYTEALGFDISDWLLRERAWLRCNTNHHTLMLIQGKPAIDHIAFHVEDEARLIRWADYLSRQQVPLLWGPGRHGTSNDLFIRFADIDDIHVEFSTGMAHYYDRDVTTPPRLWHTRTAALNAWGILPSWHHEDPQS